MIQRPGIPWLSCLLTLVLCIGCSSAPTPPSKPGGKAASEETGPGSEPDAAANSTAGQPAAKPADDRLEPFDPPTLADLDAKANWEDQPVVDSMKLLRERQAGEQPLATVQEALKLRNDSSEANAKILSAMGRLPAQLTDADFDARISRHSRADVKSTNPIMGSSTIEFDVNGLTGSGLFGFDWDFNLFASADTVTSWQSSQDRMYDKVVMRDDLTWSDGRPITAHDVAFSFQTIMNPDVPVPAVRSGTDKLRWVHAYDDRTVVYFHKEALATNALNVNFPLLPKHIYEKSIAEDATLQNSPYHVKLENAPVSGGAYQITERVRDQELVLTRREGWYMHKGEQVRDKPFFKEIRFRILKENNTALLALKGQDIEELELSAPQWMTQTSDSDFYEHNTKASGVEWIYYYFGWNNDPEKAPFFTDKRVRTAMSYAFDHDEMLDKLQYGLYEAATGIFHPTAWMAPKTPMKPYKQDLDKAEDLLDEAGWEDHDGDGIRDKEIKGRRVNFDFTILCSEDPERKKLCDLLKQNLSQIGVVCNVRPMEFTVLQEKTRTHDFQAHMGGWGTGVDPDTGDNLWVTGEGRNFIQYSNPKVDDLFAQGSREFDREKRAAIYAEIHKILYEDQAYTWLYYRSGFYGFNKNLRGYVFSARGPYNYGPGFSSIWKPLQ